MAQRCCRPNTNNRTSNFYPTKPNWEQTQARTKPNSTLGPGQKQACLFVFLFACPPKSKKRRRRRACLLCNLKRLTFFRSLGTRFALFCLLLGKLINANVVVVVVAAESKIDKIRATQANRKWGFLFLS